MKAYIQLLAANLKDTTRDFMSVFWFLLFPVILILIWGVIYSEGNNKASTVNLGLAVYDKGPVSDALEKAFGSIENYKVTKGEKDAELDALNKGDRMIVIVIPEGVSQKVLAGGKADLPIFYDPLKAPGNQAAVIAASEVISSVENAVTGKTKQLIAVPQKSNDKKSNHHALNYFIPGILALALMQLGLFGSLRMVSLREQKILRSLGVTPLPKSIFILSEITVRIMMAVIQTVLIIGVGYFVFHISITGRWAELIGVVFLGAATFVAMGYMIASFVKTSESGNGLMQLIQFIMMFMAGVFIPVENMPEFLMPVVRVIPLSYLADALRVVITGNAPLFSLTMDILVMLGVLIVSMVIATRFKWDEK